MVTEKRKLDEVLSILLKFVADTLKSEGGEFRGVCLVLKNDDQDLPLFSIFYWCSG